MNEITSSFELIIFSIFVLASVMYGMYKLIMYLDKKHNDND